ncbi:MAG: nitroreductase family deazaflavin-dependent oxidoreductase [Acidimicrobiia bacterium]|nr:nitroreductase family deazaflavin-dependent oxidoreductase [Acidimicrobiia bacterium]
MRAATARRLSTFHTRLYRMTGGLVGRRFVHNDMLLLTTTGRRTGRSHTVPLLYLRDRDRLVVFASWGGRNFHPEWYLNLVDNPEATVQVESDRWPVRGRTVEEPDRTQWWERAVDAYGGYAEYQAKTDRRIPVVFLEGRGR